jgi:hypothetical protein
MGNTKSLGIAYTDQDISGSNLIMSGERLGYTTGAQGAVTQATSKATAVTLNKSAGIITTNAASLGATTTVNFTLNNSYLSANDTLILTIASGGTAGAYNAWISGMTAGTATINLRNITAGPLLEAVVLNFAIIHCE